MPRQVFTKHFMLPMVSSARNTGKLVDDSMNPIRDPSAVLSSMCPPVPSRSISDPGTTSVGLSRSKLGAIGTWVASGEIAKIPGVGLGAANVAADVPIATGIAVTTGVAVAAGMAVGDCAVGGARVAPPPPQAANSENAITPNAITPKERLMAGGYPAALAAATWSRKFCSRGLPTGVMMDSGWNWTPSTGCSLWRRPMTKPLSVHAVTSRQSGTVSG